LTTVNAELADTPVMLGHPVRQGVRLMTASKITTLAIAAVLVGSGAAHTLYGQTPPKPQAAAVVVASEARAVVESVDKQARQVLLHLPEDALLTLTVPPEIKSIDKLKPGDHVAVKYYDAIVIHLAKTDAAPTAKSTPGTSANGEVQGVRTVVGVDSSRGTVTLADAKNHVETLGLPDPSLLKTLKPGDRVDVTYKEAIDVSLEPV
jgi:Cu/Ag efflux protein CusF